MLQPCNNRLLLSSCALQIRATSRGSALIQGQGKRSLSRRKQFSLRREVPPPLEELLPAWTDTLIGEEHALHWSSGPPCHCEGLTLGRVGAQRKSQFLSLHSSPHLYCLTTVQSKTKKKASNAVQRRPPVTGRRPGTNTGIRHKSIINTGVNCGLPGPSCRDRSHKNHKTFLLDQELTGSLLRSRWMWI